MEAATQALPAEQSKQTKAQPKPKKEGRRARRKREKAARRKERDMKKYAHSNEWIVFINPKSGGQQGAAILKAFEGVLPDDQIFNLMDGGPLPGLQRWQQNPEYGIIVCGGDGSVGWVLGVIHELGLPKQPKVGVVPLGTGNDLARVFGWGGGFSGSSASRVLHMMDQAKAVHLDRWKVLCTPTEVFDEEKHNTPVSEKDAEEAEEEDDDQPVADGAKGKGKEKKKKDKKGQEAQPQKQDKNNDGKGKSKEEVGKPQAAVDDENGEGKQALTNDNKEENEPQQQEQQEEEKRQQAEKLPEPQVFVINNYFSIGTDAEIALKFHHMRENHTRLFQSQLINKGWYGGLGLRAVATRHGPLMRHIAVELDGKELKLPKAVRGIVVINVPSYAGGTNPWGTKASDIYATPSIADGLFEVFGLRGVSHLASIQSKVAHGIRLGQGRRIKIATKRALPAQVDGEPWLLIPSVVTVEYQSQASLLFNTLQKAAAKKEKALLGGKEALEGVLATGDDDEDDDDEDDDEEEEGSSSGSDAAASSGAAAASEGVKQTDE